MVVALSALHTLLYLCENRQNLFVYWLRRFIVRFEQDINKSGFIFDVSAEIKAKVLFSSFSISASCGNYIYSWRG